MKRQPKRITASGFKAALAQAAGLPPLGRQGVEATAAILKKLGVAGPVALVPQVDRRAVEQRAMDLMVKVRTHVAVYHPFFGALLYRLKLRVDWRHPSMYTDAVVLGFNPEFVMQLEWNTVVYITVHEIQHCALRHPFRRGSRDPKLFNQAADHVVNLSLNADPTLAAMRPKEDSAAGCGLADPRFGGMAVETVFSILQSEQPPQQGGGEQEGQGSEEGLQGASGGAGDCCDAGAAGEAYQDDDEKPDKEKKDGSQSGKSKSGSEANQDAPTGSEPQGAGAEGGTGSDADQPAPDGAESGGSGSPDGGGDDESEGDADADAEGEDGEEQDGEGEEGEGEGDGEEEESDGVGALDPAEVAQLEREWGEAVTTAALAAGGDVASSMQRALAAAGEVRRSFEEYVDEFAQRCLASVDSWRRPNRRYSDIYLPSRSAPAVSVIVAGVDTSGSISASDLGKFDKALQRIQEQFEAAVIVVAYCDTRIRHIDRFQRGEPISLKPHGGGGTAFSPVFRLAKDLEQEGEDVAGVIYLTDLEGHVDGWRIYEDIETLWVSTHTGALDDLIYGAPKFGRVCSIHA